MKKLICCVIGLTGLFASAQETRTKVVKAESSTEDSFPEKKYTYAVMGYPSGSNSSYTISGNSSLVDLREIEKSASENYGIDLVFTNEKFYKNNLEYLELSVLNNGKTETYTFGTDNLKMLPFTLVLNKTHKSKDEKTKSIILKNNKNNRENFVKEQVIDLI